MRTLTDFRAPLSPARLAQLTLRIADDPGQWLSLVRYQAEPRWYLRLAQDDEHELWLLSWLPGQQTGFHDHGASAGAFAVARGCLSEQTAPGGRPDPRVRTVVAGAVRSFGPDHTHDVANQSTQPAVSIHAYSPPLRSMRRYGVAADGLLRLTAEEASW
jgi:predicted metal-dependent enzyme (double-stranded beta helix superfamily)